MFIEAKYKTVCPVCTNDINVGDKIKWVKGEQAKHIKCIAKDERHGKNPWVSKAMFGKVANDFNEYGIYFEEYRWADQKPPKKCHCGNNTWFKPTVGTYVCPTCGHVGIPTEPAKQGN